jgi:hypothetical protein
MIFLYAAITYECVYKKVTKNIFIKIKFIFYNLKNINKNFFLEKCQIAWTLKKLFFVTN